MAVSSAAPESVAASSSESMSILVAHPSRCLTDHLANGDGLLAYALIRGLADRGHRLHVVAERTDLREPLPENVVIHTIRARRSTALRAQFACMVRIRQAYMEVSRGTRFDVIHQLNPVDAGLTALLPRSSAPIVLGPYMPDWPFGSGQPAMPTSAIAARATRLKEGIRWLQQRRAATVILSTPAAAEKVRTPRPRVRYLAPGIDTDLFRPGEASDPPEILFLASIWRRKGIFTMLDAFSRVAAKLPDCVLVVAGDGVDFAAVEDLVRGSRFASRIRLLGAVGREQVPPLMRRCSVYCLPSYAEPFGLTALEAMACGKPVVGTSAGGLRYLIPEGGGRKVEPGDARGVADALIGILSSPEIRRSMGETNRRRVEERHTWAGVISELERIYDEAVGG